MCSPNEDYPCPQCGTDGVDEKGNKCKPCGGTGFIDIGNFNLYEEEVEDPVPQKEIDEIPS